MKLAQDELLLKNTPGRWEPENLNSVLSFSRQRSCFQHPVPHSASKARFCLLDWNADRLVQREDYIELGVVKMISVSEVSHIYIYKKVKI